MVKVVNVTNKTVSVAGVGIAPHSVFMFKNVSLRDKEAIMAKVAVNLLRAYEVEDTEPVEEIYTNEVTPVITVEEAVELNEVAEEEKPVTKKQTKKK